MVRSLLDKLEFVYTLKQGSWLNMAECEFSVLSRQCLDRRLPDIETVTSEIRAWTKQRDLGDGRPIQSMPIPHLSGRH